MVPDPALPPSSRPRGVLLIAAILVLEAVALLAVAAGFVVTAFSDDALSVGGSVFMAVLLLLVGAGLMALARQLAAGFRWPRSPSLVVQLFLVILAFPYFSIGAPLIGVALLVPAAVVIVTLFSGPVVGYTVRTTVTGKAL